MGQIFIKVSIDINLTGVFLTEIKFVFICQKSNLKSIQADYIYPNFLQKCKKGKPSKKDLPSWKTISQAFEAPDIWIFIAVTKRYDTALS